MRQLSYMKQTIFSLKGLLIVYLFLVFGIPSTHSQEYINLEDIGSTLSNEILLEFAEMDSIEMTIFIKFRIDSLGKLDSVWVNGEEPKSFDYDYYINSSKTELMRWLYLSTKRDYMIRKKIFNILKEIRISGEYTERFKGYYLLPIFLNLNRGLRDFYYENHFRSMKSFFNMGIHKYYFLEPVGISTISGQVKVKNKKK